MRSVVLSVVCAVLLAAPHAEVSAPDTGVPEGFVFTAGGDMIGPYHPIDADKDPGFQTVAGLFQHADLGFANQEGSIFDLETFPGYPAAETGGGYPLQRAAMAAQIKAMGVGLVSKANNHATDWGAEGLAATLRTLAAAGVVQGGAGLSLEQARAPAYIATPKGMAALVDTASTFPPMAVAGPAVERRGLISQPRPGISALHVRRVLRVSADQMVQLSKTTGQTPKAGELRIGDQVFRVSGTTGPVWEMEPSDEAAILGAVREARTKARFVVFSIHAHETAGDDDVPPPTAYEPMVLHKANEAPSPDDPRPAGFETVLFHAAIDAGADVVVRTGPHRLDGIEIYKGRPIFYGLGSLFYDFGGRRSYTTPAGEVMTFPDIWFETVVPVSTYSGGRVQQIRLYPMIISSTAAATSGVPHPADAAQAQRILERLKTVSASFGTTIRIEGGVGVIQGPGA